MRKVDTKENLADALTKHVTPDELNYHLANTGQLIIHGRHDLAPESGELNYLQKDRDSSCGITSFDNYLQKGRDTNCGIAHFDNYACSLACPCTGNSNTSFESRSNYLWATHSSTYGQKGRGGVKNYVNTFVPFVARSRARNYMHAFSRRTFTCQDTITAECRTAFGSRTIQRCRA